ncbi:AarF/UbiB family protein [Corynebacterium sp. SCR221107]|uniref:AarF/UbiB family protein n=1 Tax=Corynebacterium sp. SCR221107 TaxID=3017361 RepID=UPI0022EC7A89|nr:AarF/UbiB family protein [Corynebacterium sp. SCR221107]WBT09840.1 AarF/UbiB family protein [Corynebacterium sp. SCR221107]
MARANLYDARYRAIVAAFGAMGAKVWAFEKTFKLQPQSEREKRREQLWSGIGRDFRELAMDKGGLIVKLGQHLSTHVEVIPPAMIAQIQDLQDVVAPVPTEEIITVVEQQLGAPIGGSFRDFSHHCLGAASLALPLWRRFTRPPCTTVGRWRSRCCDLVSTNSSSAIWRRSRPV